ncbi:MAG: ABC transporter substrate-binding protein [Bauldia sp.]|nr:ABC transporter substrate-binding protein [Bauldia sp.]
MASKLFGRTAPAVLVLAAGTLAFAAPVALFDLTGRAIDLPAPAERIVTFPVPMAAAIIALDGGIDRLAGIHPESKLAIEEGILGEFFPGARDIPSAILADGATRGTVPDIAAVQALSPDLVIQWEHADPGAGMLIDAGLDTALLVFGTEENVRDVFMLIGAAIGETERVDMLLAWRDETSAAIEEGLATIPAEDRPTVAYFFYAQTDLQTEGRGTYFDWQIRHLGATNAAAGMEGWGPVTDAVVAGWNPDIIFLGNFEPDLHTNRIYNDPDFAGTTAALDRRVYRMPLGGYRWGPGSIESPLAWMWLANLMYPDHFDFDLRAEVLEWYPRLYGHTPTEAQIDAILEVELNGASANYERFLPR